MVFPSDTRTPVTRFLLPMLLGLVALPSPGLAQSRVPNLTEMSIEDLMTIEVTSASRKEERAKDVAAAVFVISNEDIHRSGMTTIPDVLRLAPGVEVAQINSNKWAVSVRGFNGLRANKLLVLIDGRSIYNRLFSGVLWDEHDVMLDDVDRIEVIRGPGASIWGANAVNGVINIVTKTAAATQGGLVRLDGGLTGEQGAVRYGGTSGATSYRLYTQWTGRDQSLTVAGADANDASRSATAGFRADRSTGPDALLLEGGVTVGRTRGLWPNFDPQTAAGNPVAQDPSDAQAGHFLGRWTYTRVNGASLQIQSFVDLARRQEPVADYDRHTADFDTQYHTALGRHHDLVAGAGYRYSGEKFAGRNGFSVLPNDNNSSLVTAFVQDHLAIFGNRLAVTLGSQVQYESYSHAGVQPTARVMWSGLPRQRVWVATSRALRTPSLQDRRIRVDLPPAPSGTAGLALVTSVIGNPAQETENFADAEAGYRLDVGSGAWVDVTGFVGRYTHLSTQELAAPVLQFVPSPRIVVVSQFGNQLEAKTRGLEIAGHWRPVPAWSLEASYTGFHLTPRLAGTSRDPAAAAEDGSAPRGQWQLRSAYTPTARGSLAMALFHVGRLERFQVDAYTRADISAEWRFTTRLSAVAIAQNLNDRSHAEFTGSDSVVLATQVPRSASVRLRWAF